MTCYGSVKVKDGAGNQSRARCAGSAVDWCFSKTKNYYIAGLIPLFPTFALIAHYIVASERGIEALRATIILVCGRLFPILFTGGAMVFHRNDALARCFVGSVACWGISAWVLIICWIKLH
ncbi:GlpM family protein [Escherichia coli]|nr:GlpM family protein [Escherichia coli]